MKVKEVLFGVAGLAKLDWFITGNERVFRRRSSVADFQKRNLSNLRLPVLSWETFVRFVEKTGNPNTSYL